MAFPMPPAAAAAGPLNPIELAINSVNTNTYFIGLMMILLNLGGRHLATGLTPEQDRIFQNPWFRRILLFIVVFVATRNIVTAFWMSLALILIIGYLTNDMSDLYLFGTPKKVPEPVAPQLPQGLSAEEQEIYKRLHEKVTKLKTDQLDADMAGDDPLKGRDAFLANYMNTMRVIQAVA